MRKSQPEAEIVLKPAERAIVRDGAPLSARRRARVSQQTRRPDFDLLGGELIAQIELTLPVFEAIKANLFAIETE